MLRVMEGVNVYRVNKFRVVSCRVRILCVSVSMPCRGHPEAGFSNNPDIELAAGTYVLLSFFRFVMVFWGSGGAQK